MGHRLYGLDRGALIWINSHHYRWLDAILAPISYAGETAAIWVAISLVFLIWDRPRGARRTALVLLATMFVVDRCVAAPLGHFFPRMRPFQALDGIRQVGWEWTGNSFPSGHAHTVWVATIILGSRWPKLAIPLVAFALLTCYSRPYFGMHYPFDVLAGSVLGITAGSVVVITGRLRHRSKEDAP